MKLEIIIYFNLALTVHGKGKTIKYHANILLSTHITNVIFCHQFQLASIYNSYYGNNKYHIKMFQKGAVIVTETG